MRKYVIYICLCFMSGFIFAQSGAKIEFDTKVINYGTIKRGSDGIRVFTFVNSGDEDLLITNVYSSCVCVIPESPTQPIAPHSKGEIQIKYDTSKVGPIRKTITINSNSKGTPIISLKIMGRIEE